MDACGKPLLRVRDLRVNYGPASVIKGVSFTLRRGETAAIVGESGSGKTQTVLAALSLLPRQAVTAGSAIFEDTELLALSRRRLDRRAECSTKAGVVLARRARPIGVPIPAARCQ